jgi:hypothetical protein
MNSVVGLLGAFMHVYYDSSFFWPNAQYQTDRVIKITDFEEDPVDALTSGPLEFSLFDQLGSVFSTNPTFAWRGSGSGPYKTWYFAIAEDDQNIVVYSTDTAYTTAGVGQAGWCKLGEINVDDTGHATNANPGFAKKESGELYVENSGGFDYGFIAFGRGTGLGIAMGLIKFIAPLATYGVYFC